MPASDKVIVEVGLNEDRMRSANPHIPYSPEEIAREAKACYEAGAAVVHYHGRESTTGAPMSSNPGLNIKTQRLITNETPLIAYPTYASNARVLDYYNIGTPAEDRYRHIVEGVKQGVSFELGPVDLGAADVNARWDAQQKKWVLSTGVLMNTGVDHQWLTSFCKQHRLKITFGTFDTVHIRNLRNLSDMGWIDDGPLIVKFFMRGEDSNPKMLAFHVDRLRELFPKTSLCWLPLTYSGNQFPTNTHALTIGGHVRVGIGDYPYPEWDCPTNASLVERIVRLARALGREPATPDEARAMMGIKVR